LNRWSLRARTLAAQKVEARFACKVINRMTSLGMPVSRKVARTQAQRAKPVLSMFYAQSPSGLFLVR
jgi:hypothetical protein